MVHPVPKHVRLAVFLERLRVAPAASGADEAIALVRSTLNEVEDEHSGTPSNPAGFKSDNRLYPPQDDSKRAVPNRPELTRYRSRGHNTYVGSNGAILIVLTGIEDSVRQVVLNKPGSDGSKIVL